MRHPSFQSASPHVVGKRLLRTFDTTLRDGLQGRGISTTLDGELAIAQALLDVGFDTIEAGCPATSEAEFQRVQQIVEMAQDYRSRIAAFAACDDRTLDRAKQALDRAGDRGVISLLTSVSLHHLRILFSNGNPFPYRQATEHYAKYTRQASENGSRDVHVYLEDATRANRRYLTTELIPALCEAGATTISDCDTTGQANSPTWYRRHVHDIRDAVRSSSSRTLVSVHTHGDLGLAVANGLAAVDEHDDEDGPGVDQVEGTILGWGERIGNMSWEQFLYSLHRGPHRFRRSVDLTLGMYGRALRKFIEHTGAQIDPKKPLVGDDSHRTKAGLHQAKLRKDLKTYLAIDPRFLGLKGPSDIAVFGPGSGRNAILQAIEESGFNHQLVKKHDPRLDMVREEAVALARTTQEGDIPLEVVAALALDHIEDGRRYILESLSYGAEAHQTNSESTPETKSLTLTLTLRDTQQQDRVFTIQGKGERGLIAIACEILSALTGVKLDVDENGWQSRSIGKGKDAPEFIRARLKNGNKFYNGVGLHPDSTEAGIKAILRAFNSAMAT
ncbi:MAG: alpha-isopropylmalate synthase regulatory domain-containing protein [Candidatus Peribacteraceae bacterium]|nr:alpha-isopropylmalate synthase regulatory domain-containing protein [Candidatus Peribacteraceae bacterium]MDD5743026.1 alpha-isopropylmalate synthase regulatory domain-containing protein [Candidatus Peribacteraceae bacterium]